MYALALIETRIVDNMDRKLEDHAKFLPDDWHSRVVLSSRSFANSSLYGSIIIPDVNNFSDYNRILTTVEFWGNFLDYDRVLICQMDSGLLKKGIEDFLEWDYVGAPWKFQHHGGNGGLSIRNPKVMHEICKNNRYSLGMAYEDVWFCNIMYGKYDLAPRTVCEKFSVETIYRLGTLGYHNISGYLSSREVQNIMSQYLKP
jgi:hypothetical protein